MKNTNKFLLIIFTVLAVATLALASVYLYQKYLISKNNKGSTGSAVTQNTTEPKTATQSALPKLKNFPLISNAGLPPATVGKKYSATIEVKFNNVNFQVTGGLGSESPEDFQLASCSTTYDAKNSIAECAITGTPLKSGNFTLRFYVNNPTNGGTTTKFFKNIPLTVNP